MSSGAITVFFPVQYVFFVFFWGANYGVFSSTFFLGVFFFFGGGGGVFLCLLLETVGEKLGYATVMF